MAFGTKSLKDLKEESEQSKASSTSNSRTWKPSFPDELRGKQSLVKYKVRLIPFTNEEAGKNLFFYDRNFKIKAQKKWVKNIYIRSFDFKDKDGNKQLDAAQVYNRALNDMLKANLITEDRFRQCKVTFKEIYLTSVFIIDDPINPENNGKVKLFEMGKQIYKDVLLEAGNPIDDEDVAVDYPYSSELGHDLYINVDGTSEYVNYKKSKFAKSPRMLTEEEISAIVPNMFDLDSILKGYEKSALKHVEELMTTEGLSEVDAIFESTKRNLKLAVADVPEVFNSIFKETIVQPKSQAIPQVSDSNPTNVSAPRPTTPALEQNVVSTTDDFLKNLNPDTSTVKGITF